MKDIKKLESNLGYTFRNKQLLKTALTHSSYAHEHKIKEDYERFEFLGDSILGFIVSDYLLKNFPSVKEGTLSKMRASIVQEPSLSDRAAELQIGQYILLGNGEEKSGGRTRPALLCDVMESIIAALYYDGGISVAKTFITEKILSCSDTSLYLDYKTILQEYLGENASHLDYQLMSEDGADNNKTFQVAAVFHNQEIGYGTGKNKKQAEQQAARAALETLSAR